MYSLGRFYLYIQAFLRIVQSFDFSQPLTLKKKIRDMKTTGKKQTNAIIVSHATTRPLSHQQLPIAST